MPAIRRNQEIKDNELRALLDAFIHETEPREHGGIGFLMSDTDHYLEILPDAFHFPLSFTRKHRFQIMRQALLQCRNDNDCSQVALLKRANALAAQHLAKMPQRFTLWTKFRARQMAFSKSFSVSFNGVSIGSRAELPQHLHIDPYFLSGFAHIEPGEPLGFGYLIATTSGPDEETAVQQILDAVQLFYGLCNIYARFGQYSRHIGLHWTDGPLWLGPYQFVFQGRKYIGRDHIWYNPDYHDEAWRRSPLDMPKIHKVLPRVRKALKALEAHPLRQVLTRAILLFQDGFAARDASHRLLRYWSALEQIYSDDPRNRKQQRIVDRASFAESERRDLERWRLNHTAQIRNEHVHAGEWSADFDASIEHVRNLLSRHINHLILKRGDLANHREWLELVDMPVDLELIGQRQSLLTKRLEYFR